MRIILINILLLFTISLEAQIFHNHAHHTLQDTLRGSVTPERAWWDLTFYDLDIAIDLNKRSIAGKNTIYYTALDTGSIMQIDLQEPMNITRIEADHNEIEFVQLGNAYFLKLSDHQKGDRGKIEVSYQGVPTESKNPPWSGGLTWREDRSGNVFMANSNQGDGASMWWPCKDHAYDEPDSMSIRVNVPDPYMDVSNGVLREVTQHDNGTSTYHWFVQNPINNYGVNISVAKYTSFNEIYTGENGDLFCSYYVLPENLDKAKKQFKQVPKMLEAFEHWLGPYPFYEDGFKLIEVPYLGMEHQSAVTYGNKYKNGYLGRDRSDSGWGKKFDFIIIHEAGHEWFANNITNQDHADMWIHEAFTSYAEGLYVEYYYGKEAGAEFTISKRHIIQNDKPIIGPYNVNKTGSSDMYDKGANVIHTLRQIVDDEEWRELMRGLNKDFYHQTVTTQQIEQYISNKLKIDLRPFFNQYLRDVRIPILEYRRVGDSFLYRWGNCVDKFMFPLKIKLNGIEMAIVPTTYWQNMPLKTKGLDLIIDPNFYVGQMNQGSW